jgi:tRNA(Ile)-lysidine synthase
MLIERVAQALELSKDSHRKMILSWSGGPDSTALMNMLFELQSIYSFRLVLFHINFSLRGLESQKDEDFCRQEAKKKGLSLLIHRVSPSSWGQTAIQERAREIKLSVSKKILPDWDWLEAHHADDQLETFLFRLCRGTGLSGLSCMKEKSWRGGRRIYRPFLTVRKSEIKDYLISRSLDFREDSSNQGDFYDRNFLRLQIVPALVKRFPHLHESIFRLQDQIQDEQEFFEDLIQTSSDLWSKEGSDFFLNQSKLNELPKAIRFRFYHHFFLKFLQIQLSRSQILSLDEALMGSRPVSFNAPKGIIIRSERAKKSGLKRLKIDFPAS